MWQKQYGGCLVHVTNIRQKVVVAVWIAYLGVQVQKILVCVNTFSVFRHFY
jgi:hypothetical protein